MKFATRPIQRCPPHLKYVAALPREIRSPNLLYVEKYSFFKIKSECFYCPLILMFLMFKTAEVLPAN